MSLNFRSLPEFDNHESVTFIKDPRTGLKGFVAIHSTRLGPATGGTRYWAYPSEREALRDALRLSRAMSYKCALADVPFGGGKAVIIADPKHPKSPALLRSYALRINQFQGRFTTGEDIGITEEDLRVMQKVSPYINGKPGLAGDLAPYAAKGVFYAIQAALQFVFGSRSVKGRKFAIKGLGKVGGELLKLLHAGGAKIIAAEIDKQKVNFFRKKYPDVKFVPPGEIHKQAVDVFSPCALNGDLRCDKADEFRCRIICGAANNQLGCEKSCQVFAKKHIVFIPDFVANAGGLINVAGELRKGGYSKAWVEKKVRKIFDTTKLILKEAKKNKCTTDSVAQELAREKIISRQ